MTDKRLDGSMVDILIPHFGPDELLQQCLDAVRVNTRVPYKVTVIDNNGDKRWGVEEPISIEVDDSSTPATIRFYDQQGRRINDGFAGACNEGIQQTDGDYVCLLNNDTEVPAGWLENMLAILHDEPDVVAVGPLATAWTQWQWVHRVAQMFKRNLPVNDYVTTEDYSFPSDAVTFWCALFPRWAFDAVGLLDAQFFMFYEDNDWCRRAQQAGYHLALDLSTVVTHHHQETASPLTEKYMAESRRKYFEKWGIEEKPSVLVGIPNTGTCRIEVPQALLNILAQPTDRISRVNVRWPREGDVVDNRNWLAKTLLDEGFDFLQMWDADQSCYFNPLDFVQYDKDVIAFPTPMWKAGDNPEQPVSLNVVEFNGEGWATKQFRGDEGLVQLDGLAGTGMMLIARRVFEHPDMRAPFLRVRDADGMTDLGEDYNFCRRAREAGFEIWVAQGHPSEHWNTVPLLHATKQMNHVARQRMA